MVLSLVFAGFDGQLLGHGFAGQNETVESTVRRLCNTGAIQKPTYWIDETELLPDQSWSGVKHAENSIDLRVQAVSHVTAKVDLFSEAIRKLCC